MPWKSLIPPPGMFGAPCPQTPADTKAVRQSLSSNGNERLSQIFKALRRFEPPGKGEPPPPPPPGPDDEVPPEEPEEPEEPDDKTGKEKKEPDFGSIDDHTDQLADQIVDKNGNPVDLQYTERVILRKVKQAKQKHSDDYGKLPGNLQSTINQILKPIIDWRQRLRKFFGEAIRISRQPTSKRAHRRFGFEQKGKKPLRAGRVWFVIDTSGSVYADPEMISAFADEMDAASKVVDIVAIDVDADIHFVRKYDRKNLSFKGGGGTSFIPIFHALEHGGLPLKDSRDPGNLLRTEPNAIVYLTDGAGMYPRPEDDPGIPTIWFFTVESYVGKQPFGDAYFIDLAKKKR